MLKKIRNMKLKSRLLLSYAVVIAICLSASVAALFLMNRIGDNLSSFYKKSGLGNSTSPIFPLFFYYSFFLFTSCSYAFSE